MDDIKTGAELDRILKEKYGPSIKEYFYRRGYNDCLQDFQSAFRNSMEDLVLTKKLPEDL